MSENSNTARNGVPGSARSNLALRLRLWRNRVIGNPKFRSRAMANPFTRRVAMRRARALFDLTAGFTYTQTLYAFVESGLCEALGRGSVTVEQASAATGNTVDHVELLLHAAEGINLVVRHSDRYALSDLGVSLTHEPGVLAMIRHHAIVYRDLASPLSLLSHETPTETAAFWQYAGGRGAEGTDVEGSADYSRLMAVTQGFVADTILASYDFGKHQHLVDIGGGSGAFAIKVAHAHERMRATVFDLPNVVPLAKERIEREGLAHRIDAVAGSFHGGVLPGGSDLYTLVRVRYDHDNEPAAQLLSALHTSMPSGATLLIAEPMADLRGAEAVGTYFAMYLAAMRSGRCRSPKQIGSMLRSAGFENVATVRSSNPLFTGLVRAARP